MKSVSRALGCVYEQQVGGEGREHQHTENPELGHSQRKGQPDQHRTLDAHATLIQGPPSWTGIAMVTNTTPDSHREETEIHLLWAPHQSGVRLGTVYQGQQQR